MSEGQNSTLISNSENDRRDEYLAKWEIAVLTSILFVTLFGNSLVLVSLYLRRHRGRRSKSTRMHFFIMHLSIADLLTALLDVLPQLAWDITFRFQGGQVMCKLVKFAQPLGPYLSSYVLTATAIDRYRAICHPLSYCGTTFGRSKLMVYSAWGLTLILCLPQAFLFSYQEIKPGVWDCWATFTLPHSEKAYVTWYSVTVFLLPFLALVYTYSGICYEIWRSNSVSAAVEHEKTTKPMRFLGRIRNPLISKAMINTIRQTIVVISLYVISSSPFIGCQLWATWDPAASSSFFFSGPTFTILSLLSSLTSCVNPWIYLSFNRELRNSLLDYFCRRDEYSLAYDYRDTLDR
ncbi:vasopressin V1a receptor-like isoform X2 [Prorops nasuta]|uniref:vasopressin V1a receptor-like isoform X2 n=1 Tax=Prorops nasuta TaxID=863751 RepID=UPI0034CD90C1